MFLFFKTGGPGPRNARELECTERIIKALGLRSGVVCDVILFPRIDLGLKGNICNRVSTAQAKQYACVALVSFDMSKFEINEKKRD